MVKAMFQGRPTTLNKRGSIDVAFPDTLLLKDLPFLVNAFCSKLILSLFPIIPAVYTLFRVQREKK